MKRLVSYLILALAPLALAAQDLAPEEVKFCVEYLEKTRAAFLQSTSGLSEKQLAFKPSPERWSVAEVAEHITASEDLLRGLVQDRVLTSPEIPAAADMKETDALVIKALTDRTKKANAPEPLVPKQRFASHSATLDHFKESRAKTIEFVKDAKGLRTHAMDSMLGKKLDGYQWLLLLSAHCERHTKQIEEVKADPAFPSS